jgi:tight adherence protein B
VIVVAMLFSASVVLVLSRAGLRASSGWRLSAAPAGGAIGTQSQHGQRADNTLVAAALAPALMIAAGTGLAATAITTAAAFGLRYAHVQRADRRDRARSVAALPEACRVLSTHLRAGTLPVDALVAAAAASPPRLASAFRSAATAERLGSSAADALRASELGAHSLWPVALCWQVCTESGAALGATLDRLADALAAEQEDRDIVDVELAGVRLSAAVMACLPVVGLLLGSALGAKPIAFLFDSRAGTACLIAAVLLDVTGLYWVRTLGARAAR